MNQNYKNLALWIIIAMVLFALFNIFNEPQPQKSEIVFSEFMEQVENGEVAEVEMQGNSIAGKYTDGRNFNTYAPSEDPDLIKYSGRRGPE